MADSPLNLMDAPDHAQATPGDLPDRLRRRYLAEGRRGAVALFLDATAATPAFRDEGRRLSTDRNDPHTIRDMVEVARHRGWTAVAVRGHSDFRREAWLAARSAGLEVRGYRATERDAQALARRLERRARGRRRDGPEATPQPATPAADRLRVVEAVVRSRVVEPSAQQRILARARDRLARWLERAPAGQRERHR